MHGRKRVGNTAAGGAGTSSLDRSHIANCPTSTMPYPGPAGLCPSASASLPVVRL